MTRCWQAMFPVDKRWRPASTVGSWCDHLSSHPASQPYPAFQQLLHVPTTGPVPVCISPNTVTMTRCCQAMFPVDKRWRRASTVGSWCDPLSSHPAVQPYPAFQQLVHIPTTGPVPVCILLFPLLPLVQSLCLLLFMSHSPTTGPVPVCILLRVSNLCFLCCLLFKVFVFFSS
jgi:hypothetical protein